MDSQTLQNLVRVVMTTSDSEVTCNECFAVIDQYVELELAGKAPEEAYPLVAAHLAICRDCRLEYQALLAAVGAML